MAVKPTNMIERCIVAKEKSLECADYINGFLKKHQKEVFAKYSQTVPELWTNNSDWSKLKAVQIGVKKNPITGSLVFNKIHTSNVGHTKLPTNTFFAGFTTTMPMTEFFVDDYFSKLRVLVESVSIFPIVVGTTALVGAFNTFNPGLQDSLDLIQVKPFEDLGTMTVYVPANMTLNNSAMAEMTKDVGITNAAVSNTGKPKSNMPEVPPQNNNNNDDKTVLRKREENLSAKNSGYKVRIPTSLQELMEAVESAQAGGMVKYVSVKMPSGKYEMRLCHWAGYHAQMLLTGESVSAAGMMIVRNGAIRIDGRSGNFPTDLSRLNKAAQYYKNIFNIEILIKE